MYTQSNTQQILIGTNSNNIANIVCNSNATYINSINFPSLSNFNGIMIGPANSTAPAISAITGFTNNSASTTFTGSNFLFNNITSNTVATLTKTGSLAIGSSNAPAATATLDIYGNTIIRGNLTANTITLSNPTGSVNITTSTSNIIFPAASIQRGL